MWFFCVTSFSGFCLVQVFTTQFCCFPLVLMARIDDTSDRPVPPSPVQLSSSNFGFLNGSALDLERTSFRSSKMEDKLNEIYSQLLPFLQNVSRASLALWFFQRFMKTQGSAFWEEYGRKPETWRNRRNGTTRSGACGSIWLNTRNITRSRQSKDWQIDSSFFILRVVLHGRSQLTECFS